ncbi:MAG TPA: molybdopterin dinucleotide binding domain-containing protein, partial [Methylomirabilota bacterium]|nr:molybdopterin dinucleotide binding domain-containing protein [Methylomirabilota bacterium]
HMYEDKQSGEPIDPVPNYIPAAYRPETNPEQAKKFPLNILAPKSHGFLNSCYANEHHKIQGQGEQFVMMSAKDAAARGIKEGAKVKVFNDIGQFLAKAQITDDVNPGIVVATLGYWRTLNPVGTVNSVAPGKFGGMGQLPDVLRQSRRSHPRELATVFASPLPCMRERGLLRARRLPLPYSGGG